MAYIGQSPFQEFTNPPTKDSFTGDGSTTTFDLDQEVPSASQNALEVYVDNVRQEPGTGKAFTLGVDGSGDSKRITFSAAPANGASIYVINDKQSASAIAPLSNDLNGTELILDLDGDTSITADIDDRIDFKIANVEHFSFSNSSGDTIVKPMVDAKDIKFQQYDGRTLLDINDGGFIGIANGATGPGQLRLYEDTDNGTNYSAFQVGTQSGDITYTLPTADGSSGHALKTNGSGTLSWGEVSANTPTSANGQALGSASLEWSDLFLADGGIIYLGDDQDTTLTHVADTGILLNSTRQLQFGDSGTYIHQSADGVLDLVSDTEIEINATTIDINGAVQISGTTTIAGNLVFGSATVTEAQLEILDGATVTTTELNIMDGGTSASATTVADADRVVFNDGGTMKQVAVTDLAAYFDDEITAMPNLVSTGALDTGSITAGFGNIDNGASNITSGGLVKLDVDADADDVTGDSATGRLTLGAGEDLNLYHGGTNSYIVNDTGDLILKTGASDEDMIFQGNDGGSAITALTLDMSAAGAAAFNSTVTATGFIIGSANINETELEILDGATITTTELNLIDGGATVGTTAVADGDGILHNDAGTMRVTSAATFKTYFQQGISSAADDLDAGDAAVLITTSSGNITIDAAADDSDIILKGTDGGADTTFLTIDGSAAGEATFNAGVIGTSFNGIPFFSADTSSIYTTDVSGTDDTASGNSAYGYQAMDAITTGDNNTAMGFDAMGANTSGAANVSVGKDALKANTTASYNTAVGFEAMTANTTGTRNIAIGKSAYSASDTENDNLAIGYEAMATDTAGGTKNIAIGNYAGDAITSGDDNTLVGYYAGSAIAAGVANTFIGQEAGLTTAAGGSNTAVGNLALRLNATTDDNTAVGRSALAANTADGNTGVGRSALTTNTTGTNNTAVGYNAIKLNTTGVGLTAVGFEALEANTTGSRNQAIGYAAMKANTTGTHNVAIGKEALTTNTTASENVAIGQRALYVNNGANNVSVGSSSMLDNTTGANNVAVGKHALYNNTTADNNTAVGDQALQGNTTGTANVAVGMTALWGNTTASNNIGIGQQAGYSNTTGTRIIAIGTNAYDDSDTENDNIAIGYNALTTNTAGGESNIAIGNYAGDAITSGDSNCALGHTALGKVTTVSANTGIGNNALNNLVNGQNNTGLGFQTGNALTGGDNNTCIGFDADVSSGTVSNQFKLGNGSINDLRCADTSISSSSDERDKSNIVDIPLGVDFLKTVRPVSFDWTRRDGHKVGVKDFGFVAQELKIAADATDYADHMRLVHDDNPDNLEADPMKMFPILVKAVQELSAKNDSLETANTALAARIQALENA